VDFDHDAEDGGKVGAHQETVDGEGEGSEGTDFAETADTGVGTNGEDGDFEDVVADDGGVDVGEGFGDDFWGGFERGEEEEGGGDEGGRGVEDGIGRGRGLGRSWGGESGGMVRWGWRKTARARRRGLSKPTVHTRKGRASVRATGSMGILRAMAMGRAMRKERTAEERMARGRKKEEPRARERERSRKKVVCMRT
jgi:hypothetical protein